MCLDCVPFFHTYRMARNKRHGMGRARRRQALMLAIQAQWVAWKSPMPRLFGLVHPILLRLLYVRARKL